MHEVEGGHRAMFVAKFYKVPVSKSDVLEDAKLSMVAETYAHDFNRKSGLDKKVSSHDHLYEPVSPYMSSYVTFQAPIYEPSFAASLITCSASIFFAFFLNKRNF
jgi:hypothetical protein